MLDRLKEASLVIFGAPREKFSAAEFDAIKTYVNEGGSALFFLGEGGEGRYGTNINYLLEQFGIAVNSDSVVRTVYYKYLHPKEVFISNGILNKEIGAASAKLAARRRQSSCVLFVFCFVSCFRVVLQCSSAHAYVAVWVVGLRCVMFVDDSH